MTPCVEPQVWAKKWGEDGPMAPLILWLAGAYLPFISLHVCSDVPPPRPQKEVQNPMARMTSLNPLAASSLHAELQVSFAICRHLNLEGGWSIATGDLGFLKSSQGIQNFIICSLQSSRHPCVGLVFSAFCVFYKTKYFPFKAEAPSDLRAVHCLSGWIRLPSCAVGFLKDTGLKPANISI